MTIKEYIEKVKRNCDEIIACFADDKKEKAVMAYQRFNEYLLRLENRHEELLKIEAFMIHTDLAEMKRQNKNLADFQLEFVDKIEAFHQQVYATVSCFILLLSHVADNKFKSQMPIDSVERFLDYMAKQSYDSVIKDQASIISKSADFRAKFIDHPQQHALHDWMTYSYLTGSCIVYYVKKGNEVYYRGVQNPYAPDFKPPVNYKSFYVSPSHCEVFGATIHFSDKVL